MEGEIWVHFKLMSRIIIGVGVEGENYDYNPFHIQIKTAYTLLEKCLER